MPFLEPNTTTSTLTDEIIDLLLDQPDFECDPVNRLEGDTPLHTAVRWLNSEPPAQREFGHALIEMMLEAGSNPRTRNRGGITALQLVDPSNKELRELIQKHEFADANQSDFVGAAPSQSKGTRGVDLLDAPSDDDDAEFSGSDDEERAEWERRRKDKRKAR